MAKFLGLAGAGPGAAPGVFDGQLGLGFRVGAFLGGARSGDTGKQNGNHNLGFRVYGVYEGGFPKVGIPSWGSRK